ncbi:hypothetical protein, partial [Pseudomonas aeruginosa]|uniref:hypothetical protein n=1 Tax=Pseudomonas aeruginosa TaxID=287 RepID=UPI0030F3E826
FYSNLSFRQALFSKISFSTQPLAPTFKPSSDQREAHSTAFKFAVKHLDEATAFKFAVKHLDEASFRAPFGTEPLRRTTCRSASPPLGENP